MHKANLYHVIKDPVHGTMQFTAAENAWIKPFIDSVNFQRLRHIKQLGMGDYIFPGAVHSRFNHCIGCCYVASQVATKIGLAEDEKQLVMIACLLHDIGHGPFSHTFEDIFVDKLIRHEAWTPFFLDEYRQEKFFNYYNSLNKKHPLTPAKFDLIQNMIMHKTAKKSVLADIVSSQLDADRLDYLLRDSHFCGVTYGQFDFRWMLHCLAIIDSKDGQRLGVTYKGIGVVEHYLVARRLMTRNIYHYQKKLALEHLLIQLLITLAQNITSYAPLDGIQSTRLGKFLIAANIFNRNLSSTTDVTALQLSFLRDNFANYKELDDYDIFGVIKQLALMEDNHPAVQIAQRIHNRDMPKIVRFEHLTVDDAHTIVQQFKGEHSQFQDWQLAIIKNPHQSYTIEEDPILVVNEHGIVSPINEMSVMINAISNRYENTTFLCIDKAIVGNPSIQSLIRDLTAGN